MLKGPRGEKRDHRLALIVAVALCAVGACVAGVTASLRHLADRSALSFAVEAVTAIGFVMMGLGFWRQRAKR